MSSPKENIHPGDPRRVHLEEGTGLIDSKVIGQIRKAAQDLARSIESEEGEIKVTPKELVETTFANVVPGEAIQFAINVAKEAYEEEKAKMAEEARGKVDAASKVNTGLDV